MYLVKCFVPNEKSLNPPHLFLDIFRTGGNLFAEGDNVRKNSHLSITLHS
jgi:hypothetical protein